MPDSPETKPRITAAFVDALTAIVGSQHVSTDPVELYSYATDASFRVAMPGVVAKPGTKEEVVAIVNLCRVHGVSITPRGAASSFAGQSLNLRGGLILDLRRMDQILEINMEDRVVRAQPGINYARLNEALRARGYFFPPEPGSAEMCTLGGMVANNASGLGSVKYGPTRQHVLDLEVVLASGEVIRTGSRCMKSASTYDLTQLMVGSEGTLGIFTEVTLKITPLPRHHETFLVSFAELVKASECAVEIQRRGVIPSAMEIVGSMTLSLIKSAFAEPLPDPVFGAKGAILIIEVSGSTAAGVAGEGRIVKEICEAYAVDLRHAVDEAERERIWAARHAIGAKLSKIRGHQSSNIAIMDIGVPLSQIPHVVDRIYELTQRDDTPPTCTFYGHIGDGNLHINTMYDPKFPKSVQMTDNFTNAIIELVRGVGGTLSAEHGVGFVKSVYLDQFAGPTLAVMRLIKRALDPANLLNPSQMALDWDAFAGEKPADQFVKTVEQFARERPDHQEGTA